MNLLALIGAMMLTKDSPPDPGKTDRIVKFMQRCVWAFVIFMVVCAVVAQFKQPAHGQTVNRTYQDSMGRNTGRSVTTGGNTTFYDNMGRTTARSTTSGGTTKVYDNMGRQTGTVRSR
jgi:hypothetical protein